MAALLGYSAALRNAQNDAITTAAGNAALLKIYDGTRPATGGTVTTLLGTFTMGTPFAGASSAGVLTITLPANSTGVAAGTATWARLTTSGATFVMDLNVGTASADFILNTTTISNGVTLAITAATITNGAP